MARIVRTVSTSWRPEEAFAYMADFTHAAEWDPGVAAATRVDSGDVHLGSAFDLDVLVGKRHLPLRYEITDYAPGRVTFAARSSTIESLDTVTVDHDEKCTTVTYDAKITFRGALRLANPLLALGFRGVADRAVRGLEHRLSQDP